MAYFAMVATGVFLSTMDSSMINIALPYIMRSFDTSLEHVQWIVLIYLLTISSTLLVWGKIADKFGKGIIYLCGVFIFSFGALCCFFSENIGVLIFSRFIQGFGASMMMATGPAILRTVVPRNTMGRWLGSLGIFTSLGLMSGPLLGGFILHSMSWKTLFLINVPISFSVFLFGWLYLAGTLPKNSRNQEKFDGWGSLLWIFLIVLFVVLCNSNHSMSPFGIAVTSASFIIVGFLFVISQRNKTGGLFPMVLMKQRFYTVAMLTSTMSFSVLFFVLILMPFYLKYIQGYAYNTIGYVMMAIPVCLSIISPVSGRLYDTFGARHLTTIGMLFSGCSLLLIAALKSDTSVIDICWRLSLLGCGQSIFLSPNTASVLTHVDAKDTGISAGMLATCRNLGMLLGVALVGFIFSVLYSFYGNGAELKDFILADTPVFMKAFSHTLYVAAALAFVTACISLQRDK